jgi:hypothetical protein
MAAHAFGCPPGSFSGGRWRAQLNTYSLNRLGGSNYQIAGMYLFLRTARESNFTAKILLAPPLAQQDLHGQNGKYQ